MREEEVRRILRRVCDRLLREVVPPVRKGALPAALGAGLVSMTGCPDSTPVIAYGVPDAVQEDPASEALGQDPGGEAFIPPDVLYMAPDVADSGPVPPYMGPDAGDPGPIPEYMAPDVQDVGPVPPYMAPDVVEDPGPMPEYMAPDATDLGPMPLYMAPSPGEPPAR